MMSESSPAKSKTGRFRRLRHNFYILVVTVAALYGVYSGIVQLNSLRRKERDDVGQLLRVHSADAGKSFVFTDLVINRGERPFFVRQTSIQIVLRAADDPSEQAPAELWDMTSKEPASTGIEPGASREYNSQPIPREDVLDYGAKIETVGVVTTQRGESFRTRNMKHFLERVLLDSEQQGRQTGFEWELPPEEDDSE
jgi:hypothetical protein